MLAMIAVAVCVVMSPSQQLQAYDACIHRHGCSLAYEISLTDGEGEGNGSAQTQKPKSGDMQ